MTRPSVHVWALNIARAVATRGTCARRQVGCVLLDGTGFILSTGYNGPASGEPHCTERPCPGAKLASGTGLSVCEAIHAEVNALVTCRNVDEVFSIYSTTAPCIDCVKVLLRTNAQYIFYIDDYPHSQQACERWERNQRTWKRVLMP